MGVWVYVRGHICEGCVMGCMGVWGFMMGV